MTDLPPNAPDPIQPSSPPAASETAAGGLDDLDLAALSGRKGPSPALMMVVGLVVGAGLAAGAILGLGLGARKPVQPVAPSASASASAAPSASASAAPPELTEVAKAALGQPEAVKALEARPREKRSAEETLALARGRDETLRHGIAELKHKIGLVPKLAADKETVGQIRDYARDRAVAVDLLQMLASLDGEVGADLLYKIWQDRRIRDKETKALAEELLYSTDVRPKASKALGVALDLRAAEQCEDVSKLLVEAQEHGDKRAEFAMGRFWMKRGCGDNKLLDCWPCLRENDLLKDAAAAARKRPAPL